MQVISGLWLPGVWFEFLLSFQSWCLQAAMQYLDEMMDPTNGFIW